jgi:adenylate kinase
MTSSSSQQTLSQVVFFPFISRPSAGKGTQTSLLSERLSLPRIDMGSLLREIAKEASPLGQSVQERLSQGQLVNLETVMAVLKDGLEKAMVTRHTQEVTGFILDGFPRNLPQAESLLVLCQATGAQIATSVYLDVPVETIVERAVNRRICQQCGAIYNLKSKPPAVDGICDVCGSHELLLRSDDALDKVEARLRSFDEETAPVLQRLEQENPAYVTRINGHQPVDTVYAELSALIRSQTVVTLTAVLPRLTKKAPLWPLVLTPRIRLIASRGMTSL